MTSFIDLSKADLSAGQNHIIGHSTTQRIECDKRVASQKQKKDRKSRKLKKTFEPPKEVEHIISKNDNLQRLLIHYGTTAALVRKLNPGRTDSTLLMGDTVTVPWPQGDSSDIPCLTCTAHSWCTSIRVAADSLSVPDLPNSNDDLESQVLRRIGVLLADSNSSSMTYSRIKAKLVLEFGADIVDEIKPRLQAMLRQAANKRDHLAASESSPATVGMELSRNSTSSEPSWAKTCLYDSFQAAADTPPATEEPTCGNDAEDTELAPNIDAMRAELDHWERELDKLSNASTDEEETLKICLRLKVDALKNELRQNNALLSKPFTGYLASFDARFAAVKQQASVTTASETACSCCGVIIRPGVPAPAGCTYRLNPTAIASDDSNSMPHSTAFTAVSDLESSERRAMTEEEIFGL